LRIFKIYLTNTSYTFALVASLAILGLFAGSTLFKQWGEKKQNYPRSLLRVILAMGVSTLLGLILLIFMPELLMLPFKVVMSDPIIRVFILPVVVSILIVFPPAVCSGYALPLACRMYTTGENNISRDVGFVLMINTIGSVAGPVVCAFLLMPILGVALSILLIVTLLVGAALFIILKGSGKVSKGLKYALIGSIIILPSVLACNPEIRILPPSFSRYDRDILYYRESVEGTLTVGQDNKTRTLSKYTYVNNSSVIGSTYDAIKIVKMIGHFPFFSGTECKDVLVIGFGIGVTTSAIASHTEVESIECVELVEGLKEAAFFYSELNQNVIEDPRLKFIPGDGRHYLQLTDKKYDLISCDPTHPILGSGNLYTKEYFASCRKHLNPGGMVSQFLPLHILRKEELLGIISTFNSEFPNSTVWLGHYYAMLMGSTEPIQIDFSEWSGKIDSLKEDIHFLLDPYHLAATLALDGNDIANLTDGYEYNTDDLSYTEFFAPSCLFDKNTYENLEFLKTRRTNVSAIFSNIDDLDKMSRYIQGNRHLTESVYYKLKGERRQSYDALQRACRVCPEDQEFPFLVKLFF